MDEAGLRDVVLARAIEEVDREGRLLPLRTRANASREARARADGDDERFLVQRARQLVAPFVTEHPGFSRARSIAGRMAVPGWLALALAFLLGFLADRIGREKRIDLLSFPLLALLAWNLAAYALLFLALLGRAGRKTLRPSQAGWLAHFMGWLASPSRPWARLRQGEELGLLAAGLERFLGDWARAGAPLHLARARLAMHCAAAGLALGVVAGMYLRGLVLEYRASWESTFLGAEQVHALLALVLTPAARLFGVALPGAGEIAAMRAPEGSGNAAPWIHLYSATALLAIVLPRLALAWLARRRARSLAARLPIDWRADAYFLRLLALDRGGAARAEVLPYSFRLSARGAEELQALLLDLVGNRARVELRAPLEYGGAPPPVGDVDGDALTCVLVFNLAQSPEQEVHGAFLEALQHELDAGGEALRLLVVVDESAYAERLGPGEDAKERLVARRRSWQRVLRECGVEALFVELDRPLAPDALGAAQGALWPARLEEARA